MSQRSNQTWGIKGYEVPKIDFDHVKHAEETQNFLVACGKKKQTGKKALDKTAERGGLFKLIQQRANSVPPPWNYEQSLKWVQNAKDKGIDAIPSKNFQKMKFLWKNVPREDQVFEDQPKRKPGPVDKNAKKYTFIDQIFLQNMKENYPKPAPTDYFFDDKGLKKFRKDHEELYERKKVGEESRKDCMGFGH